MISKHKKTLVVLLVALFALNLLYTADLVSAKVSIIHVYSGQKIQDAVNAANPGDTIVVHKGTYQEMVSVFKPLTLKGEGAVVETPNLYGFDIQAVVKVTGFKIRPLENGEEHHVGIHFGAVYYGGEASGNEVFPGFSVAGIAANGPSGIQIRNNVIHSSSQGVWTSEGSDITFVGNMIECDDFGIVGNGPNIKIVDNYIDSSSDRACVYYGLWVDGYVIVRNNILQSQGTGVEVASADGCQVSGNNIVAGYGGGGILIWGSSDVTVINNNIQNVFVLGRGMDIGGCENVVVSNNKVSTVDIGIHFSPGVTRGTVSKNAVIIDNGNPSGSLGIVFNTVTDCEAFDNVVIGGDRSMWAMWSDRVIIKNNEFAPNSLGGGGIGIYLMTVANSYVTGNRVVGNVLEGISLDQGSNANYILRNKIITTGACGIWLSWETFGNYVIGNKVSGATTAIQDDSGLNIIER